MIRRPVEGSAEDRSPARRLPCCGSAGATEMLGAMEMKVVDGQDYSSVILVTLLYFLLVSSA